MVTAVVVPAKAPVPGQVKTRLLPTCTPREAADLAPRRSFAQVWTALGSRPGPSAGRPS